MNYQPKQCMVIFGKSLKIAIDLVPKQSMYGIFPYIYHKNQPFM